MTYAQRRHVTLSPEIVAYLEQYQQAHGLPNFSATVEAAAQALRRFERVQSYEEFARDYAEDPAMQEEAEPWLNAPMEEG